MSAADDSQLMTIRVLTSQRALVWEVPEGWVALSSASVGGGLTYPRWVTNIDVGDAFTRTDLDVYATERAAGLGLAGPGTTMLTAADVTRVEQAHSEGVQAWATVGVTKPTWALAPESVRSRHPFGSGPPPPGTINIVVALPRALTTSALVQAVGTITEAKAAALIAAGVPGTGTASDAVTVLCPSGESEPELFAGVRSLWGQRVAVAVHAVVAAGLHNQPWPPKDVDTSVIW